MQKLMNTSNLNLLQKTMRLIEAEDHSEQIVGYRSNGNPITQATMKVEIEEAREQIERGDYISAEELDKVSKTWI